MPRSMTHPPTPEPTAASTDDGKRDEGGADGDHFLRDEEHAEQLTQTRGEFSVHCDRACDFCNRNQDGHPDPRTLRKLEEIGRELFEAHLRAEGSEMPSKLSALRASGVESLSWGGPDVLNSEYFEGALAHAHSLGFREMKVITPGTRLANLESARFLADNGVSTVTLTWHSSTAEEFAIMNGHPGGLRLAQEAYANLRTVGIDVVVSVSSVSINAAGVPDTVSSLFAMGFTRANVFYWHPESGYPDAYEALPLSIPGAMAIWRAIAERTATASVSIAGLVPCGIPKETRGALLVGARLRGPREPRDRARPPCGRCAASGVCRGLPEAYWLTHTVIPLEDDGDWRVAHAIVQDETGRSDRPQ